MPLRMSWFTVFSKWYFKTKQQEKKSERGRERKNADSFASKKVIASVSHFDTFQIFIVLESEPKWGHILSFIGKQHLWQNISCHVIKNIMNEHFIEHIWASVALSSINMRQSNVSVYKHLENILITQSSGKQMKFYVCFSVRFNFTAFIFHLS